MADDRHYVGSEWYRICDRTGFKIRNVRTQKEWQGLIVRDQSWERRQPQDLVRGVIDDQNVSEPRPRQLNQFIGPLTTVTTAAHGINAINISVDSSLRMLLGDIVWIMQDNGINRVTTITAVLSTVLIRINPGLSWPSASNSEVTDVSAVSQANIG